MPEPSGRRAAAQAGAAVFEHVEQGLVQGPLRRPAELGAQSARVADQDWRFVATTPAGIAFDRDIAEAELQ